jgi:hypothetical protein
MLWYFYAWSHLVPSKNLGLGLGYLCLTYEEMEIQGWCVAQVVWCLPTNTTKKEKEKKKGSF